MKDVNHWFTKSGQLRAARIREGYTSMDGVQAAGKPGQYKIMATGLTVKGVTRARRWAKCLTP